MSLRLMDDEKKDNSQPLDFFSKHFNSDMFADIIKNANENSQDKNDEFNIQEESNTDSPSLDLDDIINSIGNPSSNSPLTESVNIQFDDILTGETEVKPIKKTSEGGVIIETPEVKDLDIEQELDNLHINTTLITNFQFTDINKSVEQFLHHSSDVTLKREPVDFSKKKLVTSAFNIPTLNTLYEILNIDANKSTLDDELSKSQNNLTNQYNKVIKEYNDKKESLISEVRNFVKIDSDRVSTIFETEIGRLATKRNEIDRFLSANKSKIVDATMAEYKDTFNRAEEIAGQVNEIKNKITKILGNNFGNFSEEKITIPETEEQLNEIIEQVEETIDNLEISDKSYYRSIIKKIFKVIFYPTSLITGDMRTIVMLVNALVFLVLVLRFRDIAVLTFSTSILIDLVHQIRMANKTVDADYAIEFATKSDEIIRTMKNKLVSDTTHATDMENIKTLKRFDTKIKSLTETAQDCLNDKISEIASSVDKAELIDQIETKFDKVMDAINHKYQTIKKEIENDYLMARDSLAKEELVIKEKASNLDRFEFIECANKGEIVFKPRAKVGELFVNENATTDFTRTFVEGSFLIRTKTNEEKQLVFEYVKHITLQLLNTMKPEYLTANLIDIENMGNDFMELISDNEKISKLIPNDEVLSEHLNNLVKEIEARYKNATKDYASVTEFNTVMAERKAVTYKYQLNLFYNFKVELINNIRFRTLMSEGGKAGFSNIVIISDEELVDNRGEPLKDIIAKLNCFDFLIQKDSNWKLMNMNGQHSFKGSFIPTFQHINTRGIKYDRNQARLKIQELEKVAKESQLDMLLYEELEAKYAPKLFQKTTLKGIELCTGFRDGDLTKPEYVTLGDDLVHALMGGKTGAGKSNTINVILMNLLRTYSPEWLELYMIDFKNVEFNYYTDTIETPNYTKKVCSLPHTSMIAGTTDPEYSLSVFEKLLAEMSRRKAMLSKGFKFNGQYQTFKNIYEYNSFVLKHNLKMEHPILPRILVMLDEFQVMFTIEDDDILSKIKMYIQRLAKEARSMGIHMFFTSQSMQGTLSDDIKSQFAMRWCLSASVETSKELIGNSASASLPDKGFVYMNGTMEGLEKDNKLFRVPFIPSDYIDKVIKEVSDEAKRIKEENDNIPYHKEDFFDEKDTHSEKELGLYLQHPAIKSKQNAIILGQKVVYKSKKTPENFFIGNDDLENISLTANDKLATANLINTLMMNFASKERTRVILANFDRTLDGMLREDLVYEPAKVFLKMSDPLPIFDSIQHSIGIPLLSDYDPLEDEMEEVEFNPQTDVRRIFFLIGLNKAQGFNEQYIEDEYSQPLIKALKFGPMKGATIVMNFKPPSRLTSNLPQCAYRISAKVDDDLSYELFNNKRAVSLFTDDKQSFGLFRSTIDDSSFKFKIYNFDYNQNLMKPKEIEDIII